MASLLTSLLTENSPKVTKVASGQTGSSAAISRRSPSPASSPTDDLARTGSQTTFGDHMARQTASLPDSSQSKTSPANSAQLKSSDISSPSAGKNESTQTSSDITAASADTSLSLSSTSTAQEETAAIATSLSPLSVVTKDASAPPTASSTTDSSHTTPNSRPVKNQRTEKQSSSEQSASDSNSTTQTPSDTTLELAALTVLQPSSLPTEAAVTSSDKSGQTVSSLGTGQATISSPSPASGNESGKPVLTAETVSNALSGTHISLAGLTTFGNTEASASDPLVSLSDASPRTQQNEGTRDQTAVSAITDTQISGNRITGLQTTSVQGTKNQTATTETASVQAAGDKAVLSMIADAKVTSDLDTSHTSSSPDGTRPASTSSFGQIQSLQDIAITLPNTEESRHTLSGETLSSSKAQTETASVSTTTTPVRNMPSESTVLPAQSQVSPSAALQTAQSSNSADTAQAAQISAQSVGLSSLTQVIWNPVSGVSASPTGKTSAADTSGLEVSTRSRTDIPGSAQIQTAAAEPQTEGVSSSIISGKTATDQSGNSDDNRQSGQHASSDHSLTANMTTPQAYNEATPFSERLSANTAGDGSSSAVNTSQSAATTSTSSIDRTASSDTSSTALNLTVALQNDDQTALHVTIDKSATSDGLNIHIGTDGLTTLNELQTHKHELVHALENAGISTTGSQISFGLADNSSVSSSSQNNQSHQHPQDNSAATPAGSSDFTNAFGGTLSGNSNGDGARSNWSAAPSANSTTASDADDTSDQTYALTALRTGSVNITA